MIKHTIISEEAGHILIQVKDSRYYFYETK